jgi:hypothetical protein
VVGAQCDCLLKLLSCSVNFLAFLGIQQEPAVGSVQSKLKEFESNVKAEANQLTHETQLQRKKSRFVPAPRSPYDWLRTTPKTTLDLVLVCIADIRRAGVGFYTMSLRCCNDHATVRGTAIGSPMYLHSVGIDQRVTATAILLALGVSLGIGS